MQQRIHESAVENVPRPSGIHGIHFVGRGIVEPHSIPYQHTFGPQSGPCHPASVAPMNHGEGLQQILVTRQPGGKVTGRYEVINILE